MRRCRLMVIFPLFTSLGIHASDPQGWMWYSPIPEKQIIPDQKRETSATSPGEALKKLQEAFESTKARAVMQPTLQNVQALLRLQNRIVEHAQRFQEQWMIASLLETSASASGNNTNALHLKVEREQTDKNLEHNLKMLAQSFGLFFMFKKECPYCHAFAPILKSFAQMYGFEIKAISADGEVLDEFPDASPDNGWVERLNPEHIFPIVFLVNPHTLEVIPLAKGLTSIADMQQNGGTIIEYLRRENRGS